MGTSEVANAVALVGAALQLIAAVLAVTPARPAGLADSVQVDVSCPGREATYPPRLHSWPRRGYVERPPRKPSGSARAAPVHRRWGV